MIELIGEAPVAGARERYQWLHPSHCATGRRLLDFSGWTLAELERQVSRNNVYPRPLGREAWSTVKARQLAQATARGLENGRPVVLLGQRVSEAFGEAGRPLLQWFTPETAALDPHGGRNSLGNPLRMSPAVSLPVLSGRTVAIVPHPSGLNRWWNDQGNRLAARAFLRGLMDAEVAREAR